MIALAEVHDAARRIASFLKPTPLIRHPLLAAATGTDIYVKHENHNPTGAFKIRGGLNLIATLSAADRSRGVITASTGNHGQSIALACALQQVSCTIYVPQGNNPEKNAAMRAYGATVVEHGRDFDEAREEVERVRERENLRYVHSANEPKLIAGVATYALEIFSDLADADVVLVPIGGGSGASGLVTVRDGLGLRTKIVGVQAEQANAFARSWREGARRVNDRAATFAEGLATRVTFDLTFDILKNGLHDVITLSEDQLEEAVRLALKTTHNLAEGAGAAALMAALLMNTKLRSQKVVAVMSGGNLSTAMLQRIFCDGT